eukprot:356798-Chlamydomonas_euryale.AAC.4
MRALAGHSLGGTAQSPGHGQDCIKPVRGGVNKGVCVALQLWTAQPPLAEWIRRGQPAHTPPQGWGTRHPSRPHSSVDRSVGV